MSFRINRKFFPEPIQVQACLNPSGVRSRPEEVSVESRESHNNQETLVNSHVSNIIQEVVPEMIQDIAQEEFRTNGVSERGSFSKSRTDPSGANLSDSKEIGSTEGSSPTPEISTPKNTQDVVLDNNVYIFSCPHCYQRITVGKNEVNCCIFRHGSFFEVVNGVFQIRDQIPSHLNKYECDSLFAQGKTVGCGKPFCLHRTPSGSGYIVKKCDYI